MRLRRTHVSDDELQRVIAQANECDPTADEVAALQAVRSRLQRDMRRLERASRRSRTAGLVTAALALVVAAVYVAVPASRPQAAAGVWDETLSGALPIRALTPGVSMAIARDALCAGRAAERKPIPAAIRQAVLRDYGMERVADDEYELDYLITPELGGLADARNLWPERYASGRWNAGVKDDLERLLPRLVCAGTIDLATAQRAIAENWIAAYQTYFRTTQPRTTGLARGDDEDDRAAEPAAPRVVLTLARAMRRRS